MLTFMLYLVVGLFTPHTTLQQISATTECEEANHVWQRLLNEQPQHIQTHYTDNAITLTGKGRQLTTTEERKAYLAPLLSPQQSVKSIEPIFCELANPNTDIRYDLSRLKPAVGPDYIQLVIWRDKDGQYVRELDFLAPLSPDRTDLTALDQAREKWIELCNEHDAAVLVEQMYEPEALYYNHRPMITGREQITTTYSYMNNEDYSLHLNPLVVQPVRNDLVLEIGQCSGSYQGKYVLIWRRNAEGQWQIWMDSNV